MTANYSNNTVYFIAYAKLPGEIPAANLHRVVGLGLIIDRNSGEIVDVSCTLLTKEAREFIKSVLVGHNIHDEGAEVIAASIRDRYHGFAQKALCVALRGGIERYLQWKNEQTKEPTKENH
ncbi:DUF3870 domain-containing protein [Tindallia californiensis]|uniref:DUF3870 domain-containing protein n=2 Tax=Tindallia TaxID=69894 RepID=A0A1H3MIS0_9FIRM|nr:DUF3870 domain-containing protein [Tindallia californiensis]SDY76602.1 protein of unknown function [Tindallia californiensis]